MTCALVSGPTSTWTESTPEHAMSTHSRSQALDLQCHGRKGLGSNQSYAEKTHFSRRTNVNRHQLHDPLVCRTSHLNVSRFSPLCSSAAAVAVCFPWSMDEFFCDSLHHSPPMQRRSMSMQYSTLRVAELSSLYKFSFFCTSAAWQKHRL